MKINYFTREVLSRAPLLKAFCTNIKGVKYVYDKKPHLLKYNIIEYTDFNGDLVFMDKILKDGIMSLHNIKIKDNNMIILLLDHYSRILENNIDALVKNNPIDLMTYRALDNYIYLCTMSSFNFDEILKRLRKFKYKYV